MEKPSDIYISLMDSILKLHLINEGESFDYRHYNEKTNSSIEESEYEYIISLMCLFSDKEKTILKYEKSPRGIYHILSFDYEAQIFANDGGFRNDYDKKEVKEPAVINYNTTTIIGDNNSNQSIQSSSDSITKNINKESKETPKDKSASIKWVFMVISVIAAIVVIVKFIMYLNEA